MPSIARNWLYFLELGAVWEQPFDEQRAVLLDRREQTKSIFDSLSDKQPIAPDVHDNLVYYIDQEEAWLKNIQALCSAQSAQFRNRPSRSPRISSHIAEMPLIAFLRYITSPKSFYQQRQEFIDEISPILDNLNTVLPPIEIKDPSEIFKPLLRHILEKLDCSLLIEPIVDKSLRSLVIRLFEAIKKGTPVTQETDLAQELRNVRQASMKKLGRKTDSPEIRLIYALHAYHYNQFKKARSLLSPERHFWRLPALIQVIGWVLIADCWLLGDHKLWRADEHIEKALKCFSDGHAPILRIALVNACLGMELDASDEYGENPDGFRRSLDGKRTRIEDRLEQLDQLVSKFNINLSEDMEVSIRNNMLYAATRLSFTEDDEDAEQFGRKNTAYPIDDNKIKDLAKSLEEFISKLESQQRDTISIEDTLAYFYYKVAILPSSSHDEERQKARQLAIEHSDKAMAALAGKQAQGIPCLRAARALEAHRYLLDRIEWNLLDCNLT